MFLRVAPEGREKKGSPVTFKGRRVLIFLLFPFSVGGANHFPLLLLLSISFSPHPTFHEIQIGATLCEGGGEKKSYGLVVEFFLFRPSRSFFPSPNRLPPPLPGAPFSFSLACEFITPSPSSSSKEFANFNLDLACSEHGRTAKKQSWVKSHTWLAKQKRSISPFLICFPSSAGAAARVFVLSSVV